MMARNEAEYIELADRLIGNAALRAEHGQQLKDRFRQEFRPQKLGERYVDFLNRLLHGVHPERAPGL